MKIIWASKYILTPTQPLAFKSVLQISEIGAELAVGFLLNRVIQ
jgi:hypothetical protein